MVTLLFDIEVDKLDADEMELLSIWKKLNKAQKEAILLTIKNMS